MIAEPDQRIGRPRQLYDGATQRDYLPAEERPAGKQIREGPYNPTAVPDK